jgi:hypothetical protein
MSQPRLRAVVLTAALVRVGAGIALSGAPQSFLRWERTAPAPGSSMGLLMRTVGIRDLALGLGTAASIRSGSTRDLRRWVGAGLLSDSLDVAAGLAAARATGVRGVISSATAVPVVLLDVWAVSLLRKERLATR